jgi:superfamily II DNA or RNA helicase
MSSRASAGRAQPWPHQRDAVDAAAKTLAHGARATVVAACGSGKTRIGAEVAGRLVPADGRVLAAAPSLQLLAQTLREHRRGARALGRVIAVCGDRRALAQFATHPELADAEVTTDPALLATLLRAPGPATVACTYQSLDVLRQAHEHRGLEPWSLAILDEAHRTAGARGKPWAAVHDDEAIPAQRRLYMTATPRLLAETGGEPAASMDDERLFGPVCYRLPFAEAIELGLLADYRVVVPVVAHGEIQRIITDQGDATPLDAGAGAIDPALLAAQVALLRCATRYGIRRVITYHNRVADARAFARSLPAAAALLRPRERPERLSALHVEAKQSAHIRQAALDALASRDPGLVVVANAGLLAEGVDMPAVDAVAFLSARDSPEAVTQALGRALRTGGRADKTATVIIPVPLGPEDTPESALEGSAYAPVWRTVRALRAHDERLAQRIDAMRLARGRAAYETRPPRLVLPQWLQVAGVPVPAHFADAITLRMVREGAPVWEEMYGRALAYRERYGDLEPDQDREPQLSAWIARQRRHHRAGTLSAERAVRLEAAGIAWSAHGEHRMPAYGPHGERWDARMSQLRVHLREHGGQLPTTQSRPELATWLKNQGARARRGALPEQRATLLRQALGRSWPDQTRADAAWTRRLHQLRVFVHDQDGAAPTQSTDPDLSGWLGNQIARQRRGVLDPAHAALLAALLGALWAHRKRTPRAGWDQRLDELGEHLREHDGALPRMGENRALRRWLIAQRSGREEGRLAPERAAALERLLGSGWHEAVEAAAATRGVRVNERAGAAG